MPVTITRERPDTEDAKALIAELDEHLGARYPSESRHGFSVDKLLREGVAFFVIREDANAVGCGGVLLVGSDYAEVKRMYVRPAHQGRGLARQMLEHLEAFTRAEIQRVPAHAGIRVLRLETGIHQHAAIGLYRRAGFTPIGPFGPYRDDPLSAFFEKAL